MKQISTFFVQCAFTFVCSSKNIFLFRSTIVFNMVFLVHNFFRVILLLALGTLAISEAEDNFEAFDVQFPDENIYDNDDILRYLYFVDEPNYATRRKRSVEGTKNDYHATSQMIPKSKQPKEGTTKADSEKALNVKEGEKETMETAELVFRPFFGYRSRFGYRRPFGFRRPFPIYYG